MLQDAPSNSAHPLTVTEGKYTNLILQYYEI